jgi:hypothetical protein
MRVAVNMLRTDIVYRREVFDSGLRAAGYAPGKDSHHPRPGDLLVIWNRYGAYDAAAKRFEKEGANVIVVENGYLGKSWMGDEWFAMSRNHHNGGGTWHVGSPNRWDDLQVPMSQWKEGGSEVVILAQRGIGEPGVRMEFEWLNRVARMHPKARMRNHPGPRRDVLSLENDLADAKYAITWASGAALKALLLGVPVLYGYKHWIGAPAAALIGHEPVRPDRLPMFQRLIWAQWRMEEIRVGLPFKVLCESL